MGGLGLRRKEGPRPGANGGGLRPVSGTWWGRRRAVAVVSRGAVGLAPGRGPASRAGSAEARVLRAAAGGERVGGCRGGGERGALRPLASPASPSPGT